MRLHIILHQTLNFKDKNIHFEERIDKKRLKGGTEPLLFFYFFEEKYK